MRNIYSWNIKRKRKLEILLLMHNFFYCGGYFFIHLILVKKTPQFISGKFFMWLYEVLYHFLQGYLGWTKSDTNYILVFFIITPVCILLQTTCAIVVLRIIPNVKVLNVFKGQNSYRNYLPYLYDLFLFVYFMYIWLFILVYDNTVYSGVLSNGGIFKILTIVLPVQQILCALLYALVSHVFFDRKDAVKNGVSILNDDTLPDSYNAPRDYTYNHIYQIFHESEKGQFDLAEDVSIFLYIDDDWTDSQDESSLLDAISDNYLTLPSQKILRLSVENVDHHPTDQKKGILERSYRLQTIHLKNKSEIMFLGVEKIIYKNVKSSEWHSKLTIKEISHPLISWNVNKAKKIPGYLWNYYCLLFEAETVGDAVRMLIDGVYIIEKIALTLCMPEGEKSADWLHYWGNGDKGKHSGFDNIRDCAYIIEQSGIELFPHLAERINISSVFSQSECTYIKQFMNSQMISFSSVSDMTTRIRNLYKHNARLEGSSAIDVLNILFKVNLLLIYYLSIEEIALNDDSGCSITYSGKKKKTEPFIVLSDDSRKLHFFCMEKQSKYVYIDYFLNEETVMAPSYKLSNGDHLLKLEEPRKILL